MSETTELQEAPPSAPWPPDTAGQDGAEARPGPKPGRFRVGGSHVGIALALFFAVNLLLVAGYFWSRGGQTTHLRVEARGDEFVAYVDGRLALRASFDAPLEGGLVLTLEDTNNIPSMPKPRGIDSVRVTDLASGEVLFQDDFSSGLGSPWTVVSGVFSDDDGVLGVEGNGTLTLNDRAWRDYAVEAKYKNITAGEIMVRARSSEAGVSYRFRTFWYPNHEFALIEQGDAVAVSAGGRLELGRGETIRSLVAMVLSPYPVVLLVLAFALAAVVALQFARTSRLPVGAFRVHPGLPWFVAGALALGALALTLFISFSYVLRLPHVPDEVSYIFQAKILASGRLAAPLPPVPEAFDFFYEPFMVLSDGRWASIYPFGHPLMLAIGVKLGAIWLIPPLVGAASVALLFVIGRKVYNVRVGLLAALLVATSPFFLMTATNFMSHNTAAFYLLVSLAFLAFIDRRPVLFGVLAGLFFGLAFNTRPFTATALIPPFGLFLLSLLLQRNGRRLGVKQVGGFIAGGVVMLGAYWLYNYGTIGDAFSNGYQANDPNLGEVVGFGGRHTVNLGIQNEQTQMAFLALVLNGWPQYIGLMFVLLPFILGTRHRWDWFLLACAVAVIAAHTLFGGFVIMHGPRYWYEAAPLLMLLTARGADRAAELLASAASLVRGRLFGASPRPQWAGPSAQLDSRRDAGAPVLLRLPRSLRASR